MTIKWTKIYWTPGADDCSDAPCSGWQHALVLDDGVVLCPFTLKSFHLAADSPEMATARPVDASTAPDAAATAAILDRRIGVFTRGGVDADWTEVARAFTELGQTMPDLPEGCLGEGRGGGREAAAEVARPVKAESKRGRFLKWFLDGGGSRGVAEAMTEFAWTRNNVLTHLHGLRKDHGVGYRLGGGMATLELPVGAADELFC